MTNNNQDYSVQTVSQTTLSDVISEEETEDCAICAQRASESLKQSRLAEVQDRLTESQAMAAVQDIQAGIEFYHNTYSKLSNSEKAALINNLVNQYQDYLNEEQVSVASLYAQALIEVDTVQSADTMAREAVDPGDINSVSGCFGKGVNMNNPDDNDDSWFQQFIDWLDQFGGLGDMFGAFMDFYDDNNNDPDDGSEPNNRLSGLGYFIINMINCLGDMLNDGCNTMGLNAASPQSQQIVMSALVLQQNQAMTQQYGQSAAQQGVQQSAAQETTTVQTQSQTISTSGSSAL